MSKQNKTSPTPFNGINYKTTIGAAVAAAVGAGPALAQEESVGIEEITVTATKRGEVSIMDLAGSIQAFGTEAIREQGLRSRMVLTIHDELLFDARRDEVETLSQLVTNEMEGAMELSVPLKIEIGTGDNWLEAH